MQHAQLQKPGPHYVQCASLGASPDSRTTCTSAHGRAISASRSRHMHSMVHAFGTAQGHCSSPRAPVPTQSGVPIHHPLTCKPRKVDPPAAWVLAHSAGHTYCNLVRVWCQYHNDHRALRRSTYRRRPKQASARQAVHGRAVSRIPSVTTTWAGAAVRPKRGSMRHCDGLLGYRLSEPCSITGQRLHSTRSAPLPWGHTTRLQHQKSRNRS